MSTTDTHDLAPDLPPVTTAADDVKAALALLRQAVDIANRAVITDIETECQRHRLLSDNGQHWWYDVRTMTSLQEYGPESVDMATQALQYALDSGLIQPHPRHPHYVRIVHRPN